MKKRQEKLLIFSSLIILAVLVLIHFISAASYINTNAAISQGFYCNITANTSCTTDANGNKGNIIMGLAALTNAHGEFPYSSYPYVLCCHFPKTINTNFYNKILGLYAGTNSHAEIPTDNNYQIIVGYSGVQCISSSSYNDSYPINMTSLVTDTNSHIGGYNDYPVKIGCKIPTLQLNCGLTAAAFSTTQLVAGKSVSLIVNGTNCAGMSVNFTVLDSNNNIAYTTTASFPQSTNYPNSLYVLKQPWQTLSWNSGTYTLNATVYLGSTVLTTTTGTNNVKVSSSLSASSCSSICDQYTSQGQNSCIQDSCNAALTTYNANGPYNLTNQAPTSYQCSWNTANNSCFYNATYATSTCQSEITGTGLSDCVNGVQTEAYYDANSCPGFSLPSQVCNSAGNQCNITYNGQVLPTKTTCTSSTDSGCSVGDSTRTNWSCGAWTVCSAEQQSRTCICKGTTQTDTQSCSSLPIDYCGVGTTLCYNSTSLSYLCLPYSCSLSGDSNVTIPSSNGNNICGYGDGCGSYDCLNYKGSDTCVSPLGAAICNSTTNLCANPDGSSGGANILCGQGYTQCVYPTTGLVQCYAGSSCPLNTVPTSGSCAGSTPNSDTCLSGLTCSGGSCSSAANNVGSCTITSSAPSGDCQKNGFITYNITATWSGPGSAPTSCQSGTKTIECPAQIPLPFFTIYNAIITVIVLALIYTIIILRKKSLKNQARENNKHSRRKKHK